MDFRDTLSALLPPPRDDEPSNLRQDIIDELSDHLVCAYHRELLRGVDSSVARQRVLEQFGDPAAVAHRLWLDAMKGKVMAQRVLIATCLVVILACLSLVGLVYVQSSRAAVQTAEANRKLSEALAQAQSTNKDMLSKLGEMSEAIKNPRSLDWNPVKITVTEDTPDGPPVAGCSIALYTRDNPGKQISRKSDASGIADFGLVNPGEYSFSFSRTLDRRTLSGTGELVVGPGSHINQRVLVPKRALEPVPLQVRCEWPDDLEKEGLILDVAFRFVDIQKNGIWWNLNYGMGAQIPFRRSRSGRRGHRDPPSGRALHLGAVHAVSARRGAHEGPSPRQQPDSTVEMGAGQVSTGRVDRVASSQVDRGHNRARAI